MNTRIFVLLLALIALLLVECTKAGAQQYQFSQGTYLTVTTNSAVLATTVFPVTLPPLAFNATCTNASTVITNTIFNVISFTNSFTFVYSAATMGTNFSTNFPAYTAQATATTTAWAFPQLLAGAVTNVVQIK